MRETQTSLRNLASGAKQTTKSQAIKRAEVESAVVLSGIKSVYVGSSDKKQFNAEDIKMAVKDIFDMSERCLINFVILGDLAKAIRENVDNLITDHLEIGMPSRALTPEVKSLFKTWNFMETSYGYIYYFSPPIKWEIKIPVEIHVIKRKYRFLDNPDHGFFGVDNFYIPNPFDNYWKARHLVQ